MKRFLFCIAMLFCMCMTMNAQGLKTYSGDFSMVAGGFHFPGKATYTYKNADDGTRIYEGNFRRTRQTLWSAVQMLTQKLCCQTIHDCPKVVPLHYESE